MKKLSSHLLSNVICWILFKVQTVFFFFLIKIPANYYQNNAEY